MRNMDEIEYAMKQGWLQRLPNGNYKVLPGDDNPLWQEHVQDVDDTLWRLFEKGLVYPSIREDGQVVWSVSA